MFNVIKLSVRLAAAHVLLLCGVSSLSAQSELMVDTSDVVRSDISADFNYTPKKITVNGAELAYYEKGSGDAVVFLHGIPTWSYMWRNVMPYLEDDARVIALDLAGYGASGIAPGTDPAIDTIQHTEYFTGFVNALGLEEMTIVAHDVGSLVAVMYAEANPGKVKALALGESPFGQWYSKEPLPDMIFPYQASERAQGFIGAMRNDEMRKQMMIENNGFFLGQTFTFGLTRKLSDAEKAAYARPYQTAEKRKVFEGILANLPLDGEPRGIYDAVAQGLKWITVSTIPKIYFRMKSGNLMPDPVSDMFTAKVPNLTVVHLGEGRHLFTEDHPHKTGRHLKAWYDGLK